MDHKIQAHRGDRLDQRSKHSKKIAIGKESHEHDAIARKESP